MAVGGILDNTENHLGPTLGANAGSMPKMWNQDPRLAGGGNLFKTESQCPGPKTWNQDPRLAGGGNLYKPESQCPGPKMWNQDPRLAGGGNPQEELEALSGAEDVESRPWPMGAILPKNWRHYPGPNLRCWW